MASRISFIRNSELERKAYNMKKILFVIPGLNHGGTNRFLKSVIFCNDHKKYSINILAMETNGFYYSSFEQYLLKAETTLVSSITSFKKRDNAEPILHFVLRLIYKLVFKLFYHGNIQSYSELINRKIAKKSFDVIIAFQEGIASEVASYFAAEKRIAWVQCDYNNYQILSGHPDETSIYAKFHSIVCVSDYTASVFRSIYPSLSDRVVGIHTLIDTEGIKRDAAKPENTHMEGDIFKLISVGRMDPVKRFSYIPSMAAEMVKHGCVFRWYLVGAGGSEYEKVKEEIRKLDVEDYVVLLGAKNNPYPYIAAADVLVCPSLSEACPNVVNEAKILHVPVVAADFPSAKEFIENDVNGVIAPIERIPAVLTKLISDKQYYQRLHDGISTFEYDNEVIKRRIEILFDGENR